ncbi:MAG TPA: TonB family protein [Terracidiphilus sp.]|jgi:TonB family protein|nr:TonB family protein [Terracidiphilus sp.]
MPTPQTPQLIITELPPANYPPMALATRVIGKVHLTIKLSPDGVPISVEVVSGPQMLRQPASELVQKARFACTGCRAEEPIEVTINFEFGESICPDQPRDPKYPSVSSNGAVITIAAQPFMICDPAARILRVSSRSPLPLALRLALHPGQLI